MPADKTNAKEFAKKAQVVGKFGVADYRALKEQKLAEAQRRPMTITQLTQTPEGQRAQVDIGGKVRSIQTGDELPEGLVTEIKSTRGLYVQPRQGPGYWTGSAEIKGSAPPKPVATGSASLVQGQLRGYLRGDWGGSTDPFSSQDERWEMEEQIKFYGGPMAAWQRVAIYTDEVMDSAGVPPDPEARAAAAEDMAQADLDRRLREAVSSSTGDADEGNIVHTIESPDGVTRTFVETPDGTVYNITGRK